MTDSIFTDHGMDQEDIDAGLRAHKMLLKIIEWLKVEAGHDGAGAAMTASDMLNKIVGLSQHFDLPEIRKRALDN